MKTYSKQTGEEIREEIDCMLEEMADEVTREIDEDGKERVAYTFSLKGPECKVYDFKRPDRWFGKIHKIGLEVIHGSQILSLVKLLSCHFKTYMHLWCEDVDTAVSYKDFIGSMPDKTWLVTAQGKVDSVPLPQPIMIEIEPEIFASEQSVLTEISKSLLHEYTQAWRKHDIPAEFNVTAMESHPRSVNADSSETMGLLVALMVNVRETEETITAGYIKIYLPYSFFRIVLPYLGREIGKNKYTKRLKEGNMITSRFNTINETGLENTKVQIIAELGRCETILKNIYEAEEGTVLEIDAKSGQPVNVYVNNILFAKAEVCAIKEKFAVLFTEMPGQKPKQQPEASGNKPNNVTKPNTGYRKIKIYDFQRPDGFSAEHMQNIKHLHKSLLPLWTELFSRQIQNEVQIRLNSVKRLSCEEYLRSGPWPASYINAQGSMNSVPLQHSFIIKIDSNVFTFEQTELNDFSKLLLGEYSNAWNSKFNFAMEFNTMAAETFIPIADAVPRDEMGIMITFDVKADEKEGQINIFLPLLFLKPLLSHLGKESAGEETTMEMGLENLRVQVVVELGRAIKTLKEIYEMGKGTILELEAKTYEPHNVFVNNVLFAKGEVLVTNEDWAVKLTKLLG